MIITRVHTKAKRKTIGSIQRSLLSLPADHTYTQLIKYFFVGGAAALCDWGFYWLLINIFSLHYAVAAALSFLIATLVNYLLSLKWVFINSSRFKRGTEMGLVFMVSAVGLLINQVTLVFLIEVIMLHYMLSKVIATGLVFFWNFYLRKYYIFKTDL